MSIYDFNTLRDGDEDILRQRGNDAKQDIISIRVPHQRIAFSCLGGLIEVRLHLSNLNRRNTAIVININCVSTILSIGAGE